MRSSREFSSAGLRRRLQFHVGPDELPLLEAAVREHGSVQEAVLAGLRAQALLRLQSAVPGSASETPATVEPEPDEQPPDETTDRTPVSTTGRADDGDVERNESGGTVELRSADAARVLRVSVETVRERLKRGTLTGRRVNGLWLVALPRNRVRESGVLLSPAGAAVALGVRPATVTGRCRRGLYPSAEQRGSGWMIPAADLDL